MNHTDFKTHKLNKNEIIPGTVWLLFETLFFASLLQVLNGLLPTPLPQTEVNFIFFAVNFTAVAWIFRRFWIAQIRLLPEVVGKVLLTAVVGFAVYWVLNFLSAQIIFTLDSNFTSVNDKTIQTLVAEDYTLMFVGTVILAPIAEECLFRGLIFRGIYDHSPVFAWIVSILLFALVHILGYAGTYPFHTLVLCFVQYLPAGICLAGAYRFSGSVFCPILIHSAVNLIGMMSLR